MQLSNNSKTFIRQVLVSILFVMSPLASAGIISFSPATFNITNSSARLIITGNEALSTSTNLVFDVSRQDIFSSMSFNLALFDFDDSQLAANPVVTDLVNFNLNFLGGSPTNRFAGLSSPFGVNGSFRISYALFSPITELNPFDGTFSLSAGSGSTLVDFTATAVPEPFTLGIFSVGFAIFLLSRRQFSMNSLNNRRSKLLASR